MFLTRPQLNLARGKSSRITFLKRWPLDTLVGHSYARHLQRKIALNLPLSTALKYFFLSCCGLVYKCRFLCRISQCNSCEEPGAFVYHYFLRTSCTRSFSEFTKLGSQCWSCNLKSTNHLPPSSSNYSTQGNLYLSCLVL